MHFILSPAKKLNFETKNLPSIAATEPVFIHQATELISTLKEKSSLEISQLMDLSSTLSELNVKRYQEWSAKPQKNQAKHAMLAFNGDVYEGLDAATLSESDITWAQQHSSILSGLYGLLRPLDLIMPHRLEMGTTLLNIRGKNLYTFWGSMLAEQLNERLASDITPVLVNLASQEYFKSVCRKKLIPTVIDCVFEEWKNGQFKTISFFAKRARGLMLRYAIQKRCTMPHDLQKFKTDGYLFDESNSEPNRLVFRRAS
jgi:uncharacterized protein